MTSHVPVSVVMGDLRTPSAGDILTAIRRDGLETVPFTLTTLAEYMRDSILRTPKIIAASGAAINNTGDTNENTLATITIPAGTMGPNGIVNVMALWSTTANTNTKTCKIKFGGTIVQQLSHTTAVMLTTQGKAIVQNRNATNSQICQSVSNYGYGAANSAANVTAAIDTTAAVNITLTAQCVTSGTDTITLDRYFVEVIYAA